MDILDALSALCVRDPADVYSVTLLLQENEVTLLVATGGEVPDHVVQRLEAVWQFMRRIHEHDESELVRRGDWCRPILKKLARDFVVDHCRYAMPALRARLTDDVATILKCMRQLLDHDGQIAPDIAVQLDILGHDGPTLRDDQRQLLEDTIPELSFLCETFSAASLTDTELGAAVRVISKLDDALETHIRSWANTFLTMMEAISGTPVRHLIRRALWLRNHLTYLNGFAVSGSFAPFAKLGLRVKRLPPIIRKVPAECGVARLRDFAKRFYKGSASEFDGDFRVHILNAPGLVCASPGDASVQHDGDTLDVYVHGEMVILDHLCSIPLQPIGYIGCSEPSCLPCYLFLLSYTHLSKRHRMYVSGTDGQTDYPWALPPLDLVSDRVFTCFSRELLAHFAEAWANLSRVQRAKRRGRYEWASRDL
ncbi:hypothetical protein AURDEDRAFT_114413 [Auricularia subglabra TFB-10046 SS5]|nr:hypothetical protein AURDEDRAFT_114413 [Auricularia subglabra TFB-10046 SS5]